MIPFAPQLIAAALIAATAFAAGWRVQSWRWDASLKAAAEARVEAANAARAQEQHMAEVQATIAETLAKDKRDALNKKDRVIADLRSGAIGLPVGSCLPGPAESPAAAPRGDGGNRAVLPRPFLEATATLLAEADDVALRLAACQAIIRADRGKP